MGKRGREESSSSSSGSSDDDSEGSREGEPRGRHRDASDSDSGNRRNKEKRSSKKEKRSRKREKESRKEKGHKKEKKAKRSKEKRHKKDKDKKAKDKERLGGGSSSGARNLNGSWGKYGIIKDERPDVSRYEGEFQAWLDEVKGLGAAGLPRWEIEEHWKTFVEDFNTGTLPDKKYYDLSKWASKEAARRKATGEDERTTFDDEEALRRARAEEARRREQEVSRETLLRMGATNAIEDMRAQEMAKLQMQHAWRTGDNAKAEELLKKFAPETNEDKWRALKAEARALGRS